MVIKTNLKMDLLKKNKHNNLEIKYNIIIIISKNHFNKLKAKQNL
jgi:hypothetical protein